MPSTVEAWAEWYVLADTLPCKLAPPPPPRNFEVEGPSDAANEWIRRGRALRPGRPAELAQSKKSPKRPRSATTELQRARLMHSFLHHELQAAELMAWAILVFADAPLAFRRGLLGVLCDELRHMALYDGHIERLGHRFGEFPIRDWFWDRLPACQTPRQFVACMGIGFEGGNLDHSARFADSFREAGDEAGAAIQERVGREEIGHVRFAAKWFREFGQDTRVDFDDWVAELPAPLSPMVMRGMPLNLEWRERAGLDEAFLSALAEWQPEARGRT